MKFLRPWATPLTIGAFAIMATTGILMFFHLESGLNKTAHEWLGWAMVAGVVAHGWLNWHSFKRYLTGSRSGQVIIGAFAVLLAASFLVTAPQGEDASPPVMALRGVMDAPLSVVAQVAGQPEAELVEALRAGGVAVKDPNQPLSAVVRDDRELTGKAIRIIFTKN